MPLKLSKKIFIFVLATIKLHLEYCFIATLTAHLNHQCPKFKKFEFLVLPQYFIRNDLLKLV